MVVGATDPTTKPRPPSCLGVPWNSLGKEFLQISIGQCMHDAPGKQTASVQFNEGVSHGGGVAGIHGEHLVKVHFCRVRHACPVVDVEIELIVIAREYICLGCKYYELYLPLPVQSCAHRFELANNSAAVPVMPIPHPSDVKMCYLGETWEHICALIISSMFADANVHACDSRAHHPLIHGQFTCTALRTLPAPVCAAYGLALRV